MMEVHSEASLYGAVLTPLRLPGRPMIRSRAVFGWDGSGIREIVSLPTRLF